VAGGVEHIYRTKSSEDVDRLVIRRIPGLILTFLASECDQTRVHVVFCWTRRIADGLEEVFSGEVDEIRLRDG
jgi:hypothetical protein